MNASKETIFQFSFNSFLYLTRGLRITQMKKKHISKQNFEDHGILNSDFHLE